MRSFTVIINVIYYFIYPNNEIGCLKIFFVFFGFFTALDAYLHLNIERNETNLKLTVYASSMH